MASRALTQMDSARQALSPRFSFIENWDKYLHPAFNAEERQTSEPAKVSADGTRMQIGSAAKDASRQSQLEVCGQLQKRKKENNSGIN